MKEIESQWDYPGYIKVIITIISAVLYKFLFEQEIPTGRVTVGMGSLYVESL